MKKKDYLAIFIFVLLTLITFRSYFFQGKIPFPGNLLVSLYQPWVSEKYPGWEHGVPNKPIGVDVLRIFYPQRLFTNQMIKKGQIPFWNPYNFAGNVHLANSQTAVFYPPFFLFYLFDPLFVWSLMIIIQPILAGLFTYLFLKLITKDFYGSLFGTLTFSFSGFMIVRWQDGLVISHAALWLPFILFCLEKYLLDHKKKWFFLSIFGLLCSVLAGWFQMTFYVWLISFLYWAFRIFFSSKEENPQLSFLRKPRQTGRKQESIRIKPFSYLYRFRIRSGMTMVAPFISALFLGSFHLLPAIEALFLSPRGLSQPEDFQERFLMPWYHLITFLAPDFFGSTGAYNFFGKGFYQEVILYLGLIPLSLALWALFKFFKKEKKVIFFGLLGLLTLPLGFDSSLSRWFHNLPLPIVSGFLPSRVFFINTFCFSILAGFGFTLLLNKKKKDLFFILFLSLLVLLIALGYAGLNWLENSHFQSQRFAPVIDWAKDRSIKLYSDFETQVMLRNLVIPFGVLFVFSFLILIDKFLKKKLFILSVLGLSLLPQLYLANKYLYFSEKQFTFPPHPVFEFLKAKAGLNRFWSFRQGHIKSNFSTVYQINSPEGVDAMYPLWYAELVEAVDKKGEIRKEVPRIEPLISQVGDAQVDWGNKYRYKFLSLVGVRYLVGFKDDFNLPPTENFQKVWEENQWAAWEYKKALPRAFLVHDYQVETNKQKIANLLFAEDFDLSKTVILEENPQLTIEQCSHLTIGEEVVEITDYQPNQIKIETNSPCNSLLFLSDVYYPGWQGLVDNQKEKIYQANYAFRAVPVPAGKHQIIFSYFPESFKKGLLISFLTLLGLVLICWGSKIKSKDEFQK